MPSGACALHENMCHASQHAVGRAVVLPFALTAVVLQILDAMQVKSPPKAFEEVVKTHFTLNQDKILETCKVWAEEGGSKDSKLMTEIRSEFQKL